MSSCATRWWSEAVEPLALKGKTEPVPAYRLVVGAGRTGAQPRARGSSGASASSALIGQAWERAQAQSRCELVTVVGEAGVGKSRLVAEALAAVEARVVRGRCLPYGEGITYWPVVEVVKQLAALPSDPIAAAAIRSLLGESDVGTSGDEIAWAFRKLLEEQAPLVVCLRRHPVGRRDVPRPGRVDGAALDRRAAAAAVHGAAGAGGAAARLAGDAAARAAAPSRRTP